MCSTDVSSHVRDFSYDLQLFHGICMRVLLCQPYKHPLTPPTHARPADHKTDGYMVRGDHTGYCYDPQRIIFMFFKNEMMNPYNRIWLKIVRRVHSSSSGDQQTHALMYILCFISSVYRFVICFEQHLKLGVFILCMYYLIGKRELAHMHFTHYISKWPYTQHSKISAIIEHQKLPQTSNTPSTC